jgi:hypothetical protein
MGLKKVAKELRRHLKSGGVNVDSLRALKVAVLRLGAFVERGEPTAAEIPEMVSVGTGFLRALADVYPKAVIAFMRHLVKRSICDADMKEEFLRALDEAEKDPDLKINVGGDAEDLA